MLVTVQAPTANTDVWKLGSPLQQPALSLAPAWLEPQRNIRVYIWIYMYTHIYIHMHIHMYVYRYIYIYVCMSIYVRACIYTYMKILCIDMKILYRYKDILPYCYNSSRGLVYKVKQEVDHQQYSTLVLLDVFEKQTDWQYPSF